MGSFDEQGRVDASPEAVADARESLRRGLELLRGEDFEPAVRLFLEVLGRVGFPLDPRVRDAVVSVIPDLRFADAGRVLCGERADRIVAGALFALGEGLSKLGAEDGAFAAWDQLAARFGESEALAVRKLVASSWMKRTPVLLRAKDFPAVAVALRSALGYEEYRRGQPAVRMVRSIVQLAGELGAVGRVDDELAVYDDGVRLYADSEDPEVRTWVQTASIRKGFRLGQLGRMEAANATYDVLLSRYGDAFEAQVERPMASALAAYGKQAAAHRMFQEGKVGEAIEQINGALDELRRVDGPLGLRRRVDCQVWLARFFQEMAEHGHAHVACAWALDTFEELPYSDRDPHTLGQAIHALLLDVISTNILGSANRAEASERLETILKTLPSDGHVRQKATHVLREEVLAEQLAALQASEWSIRVRMADNDPATLADMRTRALALYRVAAPWMESWYDDPVGDGRAVGAAMMLQTIGDAFALLSREWTEQQRQQLPLPSPRVSGQKINQIGLPEWAEELGHQLPEIDTNDLLEPAPVRVGGPPPNLLAAFQTAMTHYEILDRVYRSQAATAALQITELRRFAIDQLATATTLTAKVSSQEPDAVAVCTPIVMMARALYLVSHEGAAPDFHPIETYTLLRETLSMSEAQEWLETHDVVVPEWLLDPTDDADHKER